MDIVCPECSTEYEFADDKVTEAGVTVKCTNCSHTFKVRRRQVIETEAVKELLDFSQKGEWKIRRGDGSILPFTQLTVLQQWIVEGRVTKHDQISRTGATWKRLGDIAELTSFFRVVDAANASSQSIAAPQPAGYDDDIDDETIEREPGEFSDAGVEVDDAGPSGPQDFGGLQMSGDDSSFSMGSSSDIDHDHAAWEKSHSRIRSPSLDVDPIPRRGGGKGIVFLLLLLIIGGGVGGLYFFKPKLFKSLLGGLSSGKGADAKSYRNGREALLKDDAANFRRAVQLLTTAQQTPRIRAAHAELLTIWSQHQRDEAALLIAVAEAIEKKHSAAPADPKKAKVAKPANKDQAAADVAKAQAFRLKAAKLNQDASAKLAAATARLSDDEVAKSNRAEVLRARADAARLKGEDPTPLLTQARQSAPNDPELFYVEGAYLRGLGELEKARKTLGQAIEIAKKQSAFGLARASMQLALVALHQGDPKAARKTLGDILAMNPQHDWAKSALEKIEQVGSFNPSTPPPNKPVAAKPDAGVPLDAKAQPAKAKPDAAPSKTPPTKAPPTKAPPSKPLTYDQLIKKGNKASTHGKTMRALRFYEKALKLKPKGVSAIVGMAYCELDLQRFSGAIRRFRQAMNYKPGSGQALAGLAEAYKAMGNKSRALDYYRAYLRQHPTGRKASLARRNVKELEQALKK